MEGLPRPAAAGADDERRTFDAEVFEHAAGCVLAFLGRERLRRLGPAFVLHEQRAAAGTVVRGLGVLEAAFLAIDVTQEGGAAFEVRISVRWSTSTWSRTLFPFVFCKRATSSARRMSIFPCRSR